MASSRPLEGKTAVIACSPMKAGALVSGMERLGAHTVLFETVEVRPVEDLSGIDSAVDHLDDYEWLVFTSAHAVLYFSEALSRRNRSRLPATLQVFAIGTATADRARAAGFPVHLVPERFVGEAAADMLASSMSPGTRVLFPRARVARDVIPERLRAAGARVEVVPVYETVPASGEGSVAEFLKAHPPDLLVFTSASTVTGFVSILGEEAARRILGESIVAAIGPVTAAAAAGFGKQAEIVPDEHTIAGIIDAVAGFFAGK